jgi:hypothetical protein
VNTEQWRAYEASCAAVRDALEVQPHFVYTIWRGQTPVYVGCTNDAERRLREHFRNYGWSAPEFWTETSEHPTRSAALEAERLRIGELRPVNNIRHNPRFSGRRYVS